MPIFELILILEIVVTENYKFRTLSQLLCFTFLLKLKEDSEVMKIVKITKYEGD